MKVLAIAFLSAFLGVAWATSPSFAGINLKPQPRDSNNLGRLVADLIQNITASLGDPFVAVENISIPIDIIERVIINGTVNASNVEIGGMTTLEIPDAKAAILPLGGTFKFKVPEITVTGNYNMDALITSLIPIPIHGAGPFSLRIVETTLDVDIKLRIKTDLHLAVSNLTYGLDLYQLEVRLDGLFSDVDPSGELNEAVNIVLNSYLTILFNMYENSLHGVVTSLVTLLANEYFASLTLQDLIDLIGGGGGSLAIPVQPFKLYNR